jgi:hypothetical protein
MDEFLRNLDVNDEITISNISTNAYTIYTEKYGNDSRLSAGSAGIYMNYSIKIKRIN